jgi:phage baseplate assembly protein V
MSLPLKNDYGSSGYDSTGVNQIRSGKVIDRRVTNTGAQVKVQYTDRDMLESDWLPVGQMGSKGTIFYSPPPDIGTAVTVAHFPTGIERGIVICTNSTLDNPSFTPRSIDAFGIQFKDGAYFEYDPVAGCFSINGLKTAYINASGQVQLIAGGDIDAQTQANLNALVGGNMTATVTGTNTVKAASHKFQGPVEFTDAVTLDSTLTVGGRTLLNGGGLATPNLQNQDGSGDGS